MGQYLEKYKKNIAIDMRQRGLSYSEIENRIHVPRSTLSFWLRNIKLTDEQQKALKEKRLEGIRKASVKRISKIEKEIRDIKTASAKNIKSISQKELWLIGVILYWRERLLSGNENDLRKGVKFTSSDPYLIKLFLKWLKDVGGIKNSEIDFDIFLNHPEDKDRTADASAASNRKSRNDNRKEMEINSGNEPVKDNKTMISEAVSFWSEVTEFPENWFDKIYFQKTRQKKKRGGRKVKRNNLGMLRIRVKASSMLARQISGWVRGIIKYYWE